MRQNFGMVNVKSSMKKNYKAAESLMSSVTKANLCSAFMPWSGIKSLHGNPTKISIPVKDAPLEEWQKVVKSGIIQSAAAKTSDTPDVVPDRSKCTENTLFEPGEIMNLNS